MKKILPVAGSGNGWDSHGRLLVSFFVGAAVVAVGMSVSVFRTLSTVSTEESYLLSMLVPEPSAVYAGEDPTLSSPEPRPVITEAPVTPSGADSTATRSSESKPEVKGRSEPESKPEDEPTCFMNGKRIDCEQMERQNVLQDLKNVQREMRDMKRELKRICTKLKRVKGAGDQAAGCVELQTKIQEYEQKFKSPGEDFDLTRETINEFRDLQVWDELNKFRAQADLPQEMNQFIKDLVRAERVLKQKSIQKITGLDVAQVAAKVAEIKGLHAEAKACFDAADFECAQEKMNEARQDTYPGELEGALQMLRDVSETVRRIRDKSMQADFMSLLTPVVELLNGGEWREARMQADELRNEIGEVVSGIVMQQERRRGGMSKDMQRRMQEIMEKHGVSVQPGEAEDEFDF